MDLNARKTELARKVVQHLTESSPSFRFDQIANMCLSAGLFSVNEAERVSKQAMFPDWFVAHLDMNLGDLKKSPSMEEESRQKAEIGDPSRNRFGNWRDVAEKEMEEGRSEFEELVYSASKNCEVSLRCEAANLTLTPPAAQFASGNLLEDFVSRSASTPKMHLVRGYHATHFLQPFINIPWSIGAGVEPRKDWTARFVLNLMQSTEPRHLPGRTFLCVVRASTIYAHWLLDTFPRLLALIEAGMDMDAFDQFVFFSTGNDFQKKCLNELGIAPEQVIQTRLRGELLKTDEFAFVSDPRVNHVLCANVIDMICSFFGAPSSIRHGKRRIFISRSKARRRRILNEDELFAFLATFGYERVCLEDIGIKDAARMMSEAEAVVAPHGAGLTNIIFASSGTKVLELFNAHLTRGYWMLANQKNLKYYAFESCGPEGEVLDSGELEKLHGSTRNHMDMVISMDKFKEFFENEFERDRK